MKAQILACLLHRVLFPSRNADENSDSVSRNHLMMMQLLWDRHQVQLRELSLNSGSWVIVKDVHTNVGRLARVFVLDPIEFQKS